MRFLKFGFKKYPLIGALGVSNSGLDPLVPQWWAMDALARMEEQIVLLQYVNRDYEDKLSKYGQVVNVHHEGGFTARRKFQGQNIVRQDPTATGDTVILNQHLHVSIPLDDVDQALAEPNVMMKYTPRAAEAIVNGMEEIITGEVYQFLAQSAGEVGLDSTDADARVLDLREFFQRENIRNQNRILSVGPGTDKLLLETPRFVEYQQVGDASAAAALRRGILGSIRGFQVAESTFTPEIAAGQTTILGAVANAGGYLAGNTVLTVDGFVGAVVNGSWCLIEGDNLPRRITAAVGTPCTQITISPALVRNVLDDAVITVMETGTVDHPTAGTYPYQWADVVGIAGLSENPHVGQGITFGNSATAYMIMAVDGVAGTVLLNRPLDDEVAHGATAALIPYGNFNLALIPDAITFVNRPLAPAQFSVSSAYVAANGLSLRVTFAYNPDLMVTTATFDTLCAVKTLNRAFGAVFIS
jgi:hypothetical protein